MIPTTYFTIPSAWNPRKKIVVVSARAKVGSSMFSIVIRLLTVFVIRAFVKAV